MLSALFGLVAMRLMWVQVVGADRYVAYGDGQRVETIPIPAARGAILDRNDIELAVSLPQRTVVADPRLVTDPRATAQVLTQLLQGDEAEIYAQLTRDAAFSYIARRVPDEVADRIEAEDLEGIQFIDEPQRVNPSGDLARSVLGQVGVDNEGLSALEQQYDDALSGTAGELLQEHDPEGRTIPAGRHRLEPAEPGDDLILTLDRSLQYSAEEVMRNAIRQTQSKGGTAVVSNPETGEIYALVNMATDPATGEPVASGNNLAVTTMYEPGSVNKVITLAAAMEDGLVRPDTVRSVPGSLRVADHVFRDHDPHLTEDYTVTDILTRSSNVGTILVAQELGKQRLYDYLRAFGFGEPTALDFPAETAGSFPTPDDWSGTSIGTIPIGQGIAVTPMQMLYAYNAIANDGVYAPPQLVGEIVDAEGERRPAPAGQAERVVSAEVASQMRDMMANVVNEGTGEAAVVEGYEVAGKTGTARKPSPEGTGYTWPDGRNHYVATFAGFMPADDPKLSIIVVLDEPRTTYASDSAAPAFAELARHALRTLRLPPAGGAGVDGATLTVPPPLVRGEAAPAPAPPSTEATPLPAAPVPAAPPAAAEGDATEPDPDSPAEPARAVATGAQ